ncbi:MAG: tRNA pseudouridine(55) synthase TruB [Clostridia bacterium]
MEINGVILLCKAPLENSTKCVSKVRRAVCANKAGHLGTLDSLGAGVLPIAVGKATRIFDLFLKKRKIYRSIFRFGVETTTLDPDGEIVKRDETIISEERILFEMQKLKGVIEQLPPSFSAKKIAGQRASDYARNGEIVELKPCTIEIFRFELIKKLEENLYLFEIECSAGTYIRSLCRDLASLCSSCATMVCIIRTKCGKFDISDTYTMEQIEKGDYKVVPTLDVFDEELIEIDEITHKNIIDGKIVTLQNVVDGDYKVSYHGKLFVLATIKNKTLKVKTFFGEN